MMIWPITFLVVATYFLGTAFGWLVHKLLHQEFMGRLNKAHMAHHIRLYPPGKFFDFEYRDAGEDDSTYAFAPFVVIFMCSIIGGMIKLGVPWLYPVIFVIESLLIALLHHYIHYATHIIDHWLGYFKLFREWQNLHIVHHHHMNTNYGIISFLWDKLLGTFKKSDIENP